VNPSQTKNKLAEIPIRSEQQHAAAVRLFQHSIVANARIKLRHVNNRVIVSPQPFDNRSVHTLIGQKIHASCPAFGYTTSARKALAAKRKAA